MNVKQLLALEKLSSKTIEEVRTELGLSDVPHVQASYVRLLLAYCHEKGLTDRVLSLT